MNYLTNITQAATEPLVPSAPASLHPQPPRLARPRRGFMPQVVRSVRMHPAVAIVVATLTLLTILGYALSLKPAWFAEALVYEEPAASRVPGDAPTAPFHVAPYDAFLAGETQTIQRADTVTAALHTLPAATWQVYGSTHADAAEAIRKLLKVQRLTSTYQLSLGLKGLDAAKTAAIVNAITEVYLDGVRKQSVALFEQRLQMLTEDRYRLQSQLDAAVAEQASLPAGPAKVERSSELAATIEALNARSAAFDGTMRRLQLEAEATPVAHLSAPARVPTRPEPSPRVPLILGALPLALLFGSLAAVLARAADHRVYSGRDLEEVLGFTPIAVLPAANAVDERIFDDYVLRLAAAIEGTCRRTGARTLALTAASPKTDIAPLFSLLARKFKQVGVDAVTTSVQELLVAQETDGSNLQPGRRSPDAVAGPRHGYVAGNLVRIKAGHGLVLIDSPSLAQSAETEYVARCADATILIAESGVTTRKELLSSAKLLQKLNVRSIEMVLSELHPRSADGSFRQALEQTGRTYSRPGASETQTAALPGGSTSREESPLRRATVARIRPFVAQLELRTASGTEVRPLAESAFIPEPAVPLLADIAPTPPVETSHAEPTINPAHRADSHQTEAKEALRAVPISAPALHEREKIAAKIPVHLVNEGTHGDSRMTTSRSWLQRLFNGKVEPVVSIIPQDDETSKGPSAPEATLAHGAGHDDRSLSAGAGQTSTTFPAVGPQGEAASDQPEAAGVSFASPNTDLASVVEAPAPVAPSGQSQAVPLSPHDGGFQATPSYEGDGDQHVAVHDIATLLAEPPAGPAIACATCNLREQTTVPEGIVEASAEAAQGLSQPAQAALPAENEAESSSQPERLAEIPFLALTEEVSAGASTAHDPQPMSEPGEPRRPARPRSFFELSGSPQQPDAQAPPQPSMQPDDLSVQGASAGEKVHLAAQATLSPSLQAEATPQSEPPAQRRSSGAYRTDRPSGSRSASRWDPIPPLRPSEFGWRDSGATRAAAARAAQTGSLDREWNWPSESQAPDEPGSTSEARDTPSDSRSEPTLSRQWGLLSRFQQASGLSPRSGQRRSADDSSGSHEIAKPQPDDDDPPE